MMITGQSKSVIPFRPGDAKRVGKRCFYLDMIVWLNGEFIELDDDVGFNFGCYVNGFGGLKIGDRTLIGPYAMIHTANHEMDPNKSLQEQGWVKETITIGKECWIGMGTSILPGVTIGDGVIIGAGSVVPKDLPPYTVAVGNPCKVIKQRK
jgi:maltose O-acetyltransferase